jgi:4-hydroxybenzoate polyprenyltransferase
MTETQDHTDIINSGWVSKMPKAMRPYLYIMRLDRPIGTWLLLLPGWWAILLAGGLSQWPTLLLFAIGAVIMRGAGCIINDLWDKDLDARVERTASRPLPSGDITPRQAIRLLIGLLALGLLILIQFNLLTILIGFASILFVIIYPLMKRFTWWPQAFLGLTFNFGAIMGWTAVTGSLGWQAIALYIAGFFWTMGYDTIYALQDRKDDKKVKIKSSARWFVEKWKKDIRIPLYAFYGIHFFIMMNVIFGTYPTVFALLLSAVPFAHLYWQVSTLEYKKAPSALKRFQSNRDYGLMMCGIITLCTFIF